MVVLDVAPHLPVSLPDGLPSFLQLIAEPNRLRILALLAHGERCVCDIEAALALPQNLVSHHLAALRRGGLLSDRRDGRWVYYRLAPGNVQERVRELTILLGTEGAATPAVSCAPDEIA
jgi:DNA-binding transcriptional ArsR family regulator